MTTSPRQEVWNLQSSIETVQAERAAAQETLDAAEQRVEDLAAELSGVQQTLGEAEAERTRLVSENEVLSRELETIQQDVAEAREMMRSQDDPPSTDMVMSIEDEEETIGVSGSVPVAELRELIASVAAHREHVLQGVNRWKGIEHAVGQAVSELVQFSSRHPELQEQLFPMLSELKSALDTGRSVVVQSEDYFTEQEPLTTAIVKAIDPDHS